MAKQPIARGLPSGFDLNLDLPAPVQLGDYMEEGLSKSNQFQSAKQGRPASVDKVSTTNEVTQVRAEKENSQKIVPQLVKTIEVTLPSESSATKFVEQKAFEVAQANISNPIRLEQQVASPEVQVNSETKKRYPRPKRMELAVDVESARKLNEILEIIKRTSPEPDTRSTEVVKAIIQLVYEARAFYDFSRIPQRGKWGTVSEKQFPSALSASFQQAVQNWLRTTVS